MLITVIDQTNAVIPGATVTVMGTEPLTQKAEHPPVQTTPNGLATVTGLTPGRYTARAEFQGFFPGVLKEVRVRQGDNRHIIVLLVENFAETVDVKQDAQAGAADRRSDAFGSVLTREQMDALSDDPDEMQRQLMDMAGPGAILRIDSFEGRAAAAEVADQVDSRHARSVCRREPQRRLVLRRGHHPAGHRAHSHRRQTTGCATAR